LVAAEALGEARALSDWRREHKVLGKSEERWNGVDLGRSLTLTIHFNRRKERGKLARRTKMNHCPEARFAAAESLKIGIRDIGQYEEQKKNPRPQKPRAGHPRQLLRDELQQQMASHQISPGREEKSRRPADL